MVVVAVAAVAAKNHAVETHDCASLIWKNLDTQSRVSTNYIHKAHGLRIPVHCRSHRF
jgi:hypothetical protein